MAGRAGADDRATWTGVAERLAAPALRALAARELRATMPVEAAPGVTDRPGCTHLEALGRLLMGLAPWLELTDDGSDEGRLRAEYGALARAAIDAATDPDSPDRLDFGGTPQALVDTAFLAQAVLRAPTALWERLPAPVQDRLAAALAESRAIAPPECNWLLFSATVEAALCRMGRTWNVGPIAYALRRHAEWYVGDGVYGDGPEFAWDYYNSFVIQPMLVDVLAAVGDRAEFTLTYAEALRRARRWAAALERLISPEGTIPPLGRSLTYRFGALQSLGQMALLRQLPDGVSPAQVRCAMTAVIRRLIEAPGTFDVQGWLRIGFCGAQPSLGERYISTGSLYLCAAGLLPLGLPASDRFWTDPPAPWTSRRIYFGADLPADHKL